MATNNIDNIAKGNKKLLFLFLGIASLALVLTIGYFTKNSVTAANQKNELTAIGTIEARTALASFKIPGKLDTILVEEGAKVQKGQELATLENNQLLAKLNQAEGALSAATSTARQANEAVDLTAQQVEATIAQMQAKVAQAEVAVKNAQQLYDRVSILHENNAVSANEFDKVQNNYHLAQSQLAEAQAALNQAISARLQVQTAQSQYQAAQGQSSQAQGAVEEAQSYLADAHLKAPIAGYITQKFLEEGEMLNAGTPVFEVTDLEHPYVKVYISEKKIGRVYLNQPVEVRVEAFPNQVFKGKVVWINDAGEFAVKKAVNEQHEHDIRSFEVKIDIPNAELLLKVGMTAQVKLLEGAK